MGAWASGLQGIGNVGSDVAGGKQILAQQKQQEVMNRLNAFAAQAKLQQLQQQLKNTPEAQIATVEKILGRPLSDSEKSSLLGVAPPQPKQPKISYQTIVGPDGKPHRYSINEETNERQDLGTAYEKPEPTKEPKTDWQTFMTDPRTGKPFPDGKPHKLLMDDAGKVVSDGGVEYERPIKASGGEKPLSKAQLAAQFNQTLNAFKTQLGEASSSYNQANSQKSSHPFYSKMGLLGTDPETARASRDRAARAVSYLLSQKQAVLSGKADAQEVSDKAQSILDGSDTGGGGAVLIPQGAIVGGSGGSY